ncbi:MAG: hypothetical protein A2097_05910 [Desulfobacula sp. GWF2_41_7]|nr:MAG: hypothetical protein A2097_05910 [Desulfobacula sp. GWF2_41_7]
MIKKFNNTKGFTLIELMIVVAIIGILAAIAVPQFQSYRLRSYNSGAKAVVHNIKADNGNLNSELGVFGHTEATPAALNAADPGVGAAGAVTGAAMDTSLVANAAAIVGAGPTTAGGRLVGSTFDGLRTIAVALSLGPNMIAQAQSINTTNDVSSYHAFARHFKGDTAYAIDQDVENVVYSVTNPAWPNVAGLGATVVVPAIPPAEDILNIAGGGAPLPNWTRVR